jgi:hypothetical protein
MPRPQASPRLPARGAFLSGPGLAARGAFLSGPGLAARAAFLSGPGLAARAAFLTVAVAATAVGAVMVVAPGSTGSTFAWGLGPPPLAALVGWLYLASAVVFGLAAFRPWEEVRGLCAAALALTLPTLAATLIHAEVFDFGRPAAVVWLILFFAFPAIFGGLLAARRGRVRGPLLPPAIRAGLALLAGALGLCAVAVWVDVAAASSRSPFELAPMGGRFVGAWLAFGAVLAAWPAVRGTAVEARLPLLALALYPLGALAAAGLHYDALGPPGRRLVYLLALALVAAFAGVSGRARRAAAGYRFQRALWRIDRA